MTGGQLGLNSKTFVHLGKLSYGLYLFHYPAMIYLVEARMHWSVILCLGGAVSYILAWFSFNTIELLARRYRDRYTATPAACP